MRGWEPCADTLPSFCTANTPDHARTLIGSCVETNSRAVMSRAAYSFLPGGTLK